MDGMPIWKLGEKGRWGGFDLGQNSYSRLKGRNAPKALPCTERHVATPSALSFHGAMLSTTGTLELVLYFWNSRNNQCSPGKQTQEFYQEHYIFK